MKNKAKATKFIGDFKYVKEIEAKYRNGNKTTYCFKNQSSRERDIQKLLDELDWSQVEEIEIEYIGSKDKKMELKRANAVNLKVEGNSQPKIYTTPIGKCHQK
jgi:hypothetical protein